MSYASQLYGDNGSSGSREDCLASSSSSWYPSGDSTFDAPNYENDQQLRARLDSGSYSNSSTSTTSEGGTKKNKRRSHRPRGCRGGGARRARKALREQARAREAVLQENVQQYPPQYVNGGGDVVGLFKDPYHQHAGSNRAPTPPPLLQPCMSTLSNDSSTSYSASELYNIFTPANTTQNQYVDSQGHARKRVPYGTMTYSESSAAHRGGNNSSMTTSDANVHSHNAAASYHPNTNHPSQATMMGGFVNVLPPLPIDDTEKEPETFEGPNPYSLKSNLCPEVASTLRPDAQMYKPTIDNNDNKTHDSERLEKQRNMGDDSLFVTSPRSFLTGRKGTF